jgi:hypothetical protein
MTRSPKLSAIESPKIEKESPLSQVAILVGLLDSMEEENHTLRLCLEQALAEVSRQKYRIDRFRKELKRG